MARWIDRLAARALAGKDLAVRSTELAIPSRRGVRAPSGTIVPPNQYTAPGQPLYPEVNEPGMVRGYERNVYAYRAVRTLADDISSLPFLAGNAVLKREKPNARMGTLLGPPPGSPNAKWSATRLWRYVITQWLILGKFALVPEYGPDGQTIVALWPLMAQYIRPVPNFADSGSTGYFASFDYGNRGSAHYRSYRPGEIFYCYRPSQSDFRQPESVLRAAMPDISHHQMLKAFESNFLSNNGVPAHLIITPPFADDASRQGFRSQFVAEFGGVQNAGKAAFAERDYEPGEAGGSVDTVDVKTIGLSQKDAQLSESREATVRDIMTPLGVPMSKLGDASGRTFSNAAQEDKDYWRGVVKSLVTELDDEINTNVAPFIEAEISGWHDLSGVRQLRPDPVFADDGEALALIQAGVITRDEYRADRGLPAAQAVGLTEPVAAPVLVHLTGTADPAVNPAIDPPAVRQVPVPSASFGTLLAKHLGLLLDEQRTALSQRLAGRRARRSYGRLTAEGTYDVAHWQRRATAILSPVLAELGCDDARASRLGQDVTSAVLGRYAEALSMHVGDPGTDALLSFVFDDPAEILAVLTNDLKLEMSQ